MRKNLLRLLSLLLVFLLTGVFGGCGKVDVTIQDIIEAGRTSSILREYESYLVTVDMPDSGYSYSCYVDGEYYFYSDATMAELTSTKEKCGYYEISNKNPDGYFMRTLNATGKDFDMSISENCLFDEEFTAKEEITERRKKDGNIYVTAEMPAEPTREFFGEMFELKPGDRLQVEYILDAKTGMLLSSTQSFVSTDGGVKVFGTLTVQYNAAKPEKMTGLLACVAQTENVNTLTITLDPGTTEEKTYSITYPYGGYSNLSLPDGYTVFYSDRECTVEYTPDETPRDTLILYTKKNIQ